MKHLENIEKLEKLNRSYNFMSSYKSTELSKNFNHNLGNTKFIEVLENEKIVLYNETVTTKKDIEKILSIFENYKLVGINLPYYSNSSLLAVYHHTNL